MLYLDYRELRELHQSPTENENNPLKKGIVAGCCRAAIRVAKIRIGREVTIMVELIFNNFLGFHKFGNFLLNLLIMFLK
jgi:hypothetical protein